MIDDVGGHGPQTGEPMEPLQSVYTNDLEGTCRWLSGKLRSMISLERPDEIDALNHQAETLLDAANYRLGAPSPRAAIEQYRRLLPRSDRAPEYSIGGGYLRVGLGGEVVDVFPLSEEYLSE